MSDTARQVGVIPATLMVAGNMMGSGVFLLPASLAATGGIAIFGWAVTIVGALALAIVFAKMSSLDPSPGGAYAYARRAFGPAFGYQTNLVYWLAGWIGNVAIVIVGVGYLSYFFPFLHNPLAAAITGVLILWFFVGVNIVGPGLATTLQSYTTSIALIPIGGVAIFGWFWFSSDTYMAAWNVTGASSISAIQGTLNVTLWAFIGVETASVAAGVVKDPKRNVPIATVGGVLIAATCYVLACTAIMGIVPNADLQLSASPFGDAVRLAIGDTGGAIVALCAAVGCLGSLGGWILVTSQSAKAAADDGLFPPIFRRTNADGTPVAGLVIVGILMTIVQMMAISPTASEQFGIVSSTSVLLTLIPYIYTCAALLLVGHGHFRDRTYFFHMAVIIAFIYSIWAITGTSATQVVAVFIVTMTSLALYTISYNRTHPAVYPLGEPEDGPPFAGEPVAERGIA
jgi:arginine:agmatine antiporter